MEAPYSSNTACTMPKVVAPIAALSMTPRSKWLQRKMTLSSSWSAPKAVGGVRVLPSRLMGGSGGAMRLSSRVDTTCLPVHSCCGLKIAGTGRTMSLSALTTSVPSRPDVAMYTSCMKSALLRKVSLQVSLTPEATWSWIRPRNGLPLVGTMYWLSVFMMIELSARASSFWIEGNAERERGKEGCKQRQGR